MLAGGRNRRDVGVRTGASVRALATPFGFGLVGLRKGLEGGRQRQQGWWSGEAARLPSAMGGGPWRNDRHRDIHVKPLG
jgi:hypothetical protein